MTGQKLSLCEYIRRLSPLKALKIQDEDKALAKYNKIINNLYLGNCQAAKDKDFFESQKIKAVLNCSKEIPNYFRKNKNIEYLRIPVDDSLKQKDLDLMLEYMPLIVQFVHKHVFILKQNILVHCHAGRQRSCIAVATYLVAKYNMNPFQACEFVLKKRPESFFFGNSLNFDSSILKFYSNRRKK